MSNPKVFGGKTTIYEVTWYEKTDFQKTERPLSIDGCRLLNDKREDTVSLTRHKDGSWQDQREVVLIKFEKSKLSVELQYGQRKSLPKSIQEMESRISQLKDLMAQPEAESHKLSRKNQ